MSDGWTQPVELVQISLYFEGGDADGVYERRVIARDVAVIGGPDSSRSTYERTGRTIRGNGDTWHVWTHNGDWHAGRGTTAQ